MSDRSKPDPLHALARRERYKRLRARDAASRRKVEEALDELERLEAEEEAKARRWPRVLRQELLAIVRAGLGLPQRL